MTRLATKNSEWGQVERKQKTRMKDSTMSTQQPTQTNQGGNPKRDYCGCPSQSKGINTRRRFQLLDYHWILIWVVRLHHRIRSTSSNLVDMKLVAE